MCGSQLEWSRRRKTIANGVASILHGVVAIVSAEFGLHPGRITPCETAGAARKCIRPWIARAAFQSNH